MKYFFIVIIQIIVNAGFAQNSIDLVNIYWRPAPLKPISENGLPGTFNSLVANFKLPIKLNEANIIITGAEYQYNTIKYSEKSIINTYSFASSTIQLGLQHNWNERSKMLFMVLGKFNTDYNENMESAYQIGGVALGTTARSENFDWKYGLYYNGEFFGPMFVPLVGFNWKINEKWRLKTILPINLELSYQPKLFFRTGLRFDGVNGSYRADVILDGLITPNEYIDKADNNIWGFAEFLVGKNCWIHFKTGTSIIRTYTFYSNNEQLKIKIGPVNIGDNRKKGIQPIRQDGLSFEMRFIYRLPID